MGVPRHHAPAPVQVEDADMAVVQQGHEDAAAEMAAIKTASARPAARHQGLGRRGAGGEAELDPTEMREFFRIIAEQAGHMRGLIRDLLDAGRVDAGRLSVAAEFSEVAALVERA